MKSEPVSIAAPVTPTRSGGQETGDDRRSGGDGPDRPGTDGGRPGLSGEERGALLAGWLAGVAIVVMIMVFDILTRSHDHPELGVVAPVIGEGSSAFVTAVLLSLPAAVALWMRRTSPPWWKAAAVHAVAAAIYPVLHVSGFVALRTLAYPVFLGRGYRFGPLVSEFLYEAGKDVPAYALGAAAFWAVLRWRAPPRPTASDPVAPAWFDIRDGARLVRAPMSQILAVRSAGNYAEFLLSDGRRPLMRTSLGGLEARLGPHGFVRTHRSWLVNAAVITGLRPDGSGDYTVELGAVEAPLSRRFPQALAVLRL